MDLFATKIKLNPQIKSQDVFFTIKEWLENSPHYNINEIVWDNSKEEQIQNTSESTSVHILSSEINNDKIFACRFINKEDQRIWRTDCIYSETNKSISVKLSCEEKGYSTKMPKLNKPHLIKLLFDKNMTDQSGVLPIVDYPIKLSESDKDLKLCAQIMSGDPIINMPMVYLSYDAYNPEQYIVAPQQLAIQLSGEAHVLIEPNKDFAIKLRELANNNNAYHGYVGIYFPGTCYRQIIGYNDYNIKGRIDKRAVAHDITLAVQQAVLNHTNINDWSWEGIYLNFQKRKLFDQTRLAEKSSTELNDFLQLFDAENKVLKDKISSLQEELDKKNAQLENLKQKYYGAKIELKSDVNDFYTDESKDLIINILSLAKNKMLQNSRPAEILDHILKINKPTGCGKEIMKEINNALKETSLRQRRQRLRGCGFTVEEGKHDKIIFHDEKYCFTLANTPSDSRSGANMLSDIAKKIDINKNFF